MEPLTAAKKINSKIIELEELKKELPILAHKKAETMATYEKELSKAIISSTAPVSICEKIARGQISNLKMDMDLAESMYKNCLKIIDITQAQLNGFQSINRYLSELDD